jgi:hypothetical protein
MQHDSAELCDRLAHATTPGTLCRELYAQGLVISVMGGRCTRTIACGNLTAS